MLGHCRHIPSTTSSISNTSAGNDANHHCVASRVCENRTHILYHNNYCCDVTHDIDSIAPKNLNDSKNSGELLLLLLTISNELYPILKDSTYNTNRVPFTII